MWFGKCPCASNRRKQKLTITWMRTSNRSKAVTAKSEGRSAYEPAGLIQTSRQAVHPPGVQSHRFTLALHQKTLMTVSPCCPLPRGSPTLPCEWESKPVSAKLFSLWRNRTRETQTKSSSDTVNNRNKIESVSHLWVQSITNTAQAFSSGQSCQNTLNLPV